jgi:hypothetical protein
MRQHDTTTTPGTAPLSWNQAELLRFQRAEPNDQMWNLHHAWRITGPLDETALRQSIALLMARHHILRTTYDAETQYVQPDPKLPWEVVPVTGRTTAEQEQRAMERCRAEADTPFDLRSGPAMRTTLLRLAEDDHVLAITIHHIAVDARSSLLLFRDLSDAYAAFAAGAEPTLPPIRRQYVEFAHEQRRAADTDAAKQALAAWEGTDAPAPRRRNSYAADVHMWTMSAALRSQVEQFIRSTGSTLPAVLATGLLYALGRQGVERPAVLWPVPNRPDDFAETMGFFADRVLIRPERTDSISALHAAVHASMQNGPNHGLPHEQILDTVAPDRDVTAHPLAQAMLQLVDMSYVPPLSIKDTTTTLFSPGLPYTRALDIETNVLVDRDGDVTVYTVYAMDCYNSSSVERLTTDMVAGVSLLVSDQPVPHGQPSRIPAENQN